MSFCLYMLATHPSSQRACQEELDQIYNQTEELNYTDLSELKYLEKCIKETLRLYPSIPTISRRIVGSNDVDVDGHLVPPGTNIIMLNYHLQRDNEYFKNPDQFIPERFDSSHQNYSYVPFSAGPRNCIGQR